MEPETLQVKLLVKRKPPQKQKIDLNDFIHYISIKDIENYIYSDYGYKDLMPRDISILNYRVAKLKKQFELNGYTIIESNTNARSNNL